MPYRIIDTHIHTWDLQRAAYPWLENDTSLLKQNWYLDALNEERIAAGITDGILVQASNNTADTAFMLEEAARFQWIKAVVIWLPLENPAEMERLLNEVYKDNTYVKGVRHLIHNEPDTKWLLQPAVMESLAILAARNLPFDLVGILPAHIQTALKVAERLPSLKMVFDHLNQPPIAAREWGEWGTLMKEAATHSNLYAKISGLGTASGNLNNWKPSDLRSCIAFALEHFGINRCFCGGDWPVSLLAGSYTKTWEAYKMIVTQLVSEAAAQRVFYDNAAIFYGL